MTTPGPPINPITRRFENHPKILVLRNLDKAIDPETERIVMEEITKDMQWNDTKAGVQNFFARLPITSLFVSRRQTIQDEQKYYELQELRWQAQEIRRKTKDVRQELEEARKQEAEQLRQLEEARETPEQRAFRLHSNFERILRQNKRS